MVPLMSDDPEVDFADLQETLEEVIKEMQSQMGRFPTQDEVVGFVWGSDSEKTDILEGRFKSGS